MRSEIAAPESLLSAMLKRENNATHQMQVAQVEAAEVAAAAAEERLLRAIATLKHAPLTGDKAKVDAAVTEKAAAEDALQLAKSSIQKLRGDFIEGAPTPAQLVDERRVDAPGSGKKWTSEKLSELKAYREANTMKATADKFGITEQRIRQLLPRAKPKAGLFAGLIRRT